MSKVSKIVAIGVVSMALAVTAQARSFGEIYTQCGIGGILTFPIPAPAQAPLAVISNVVWDLGTTAISSNISSGDTCAATPAKVVAYIDSSYKQLENDLAKGEGEYLDGLVAMTQPANMTKESYVSKIRADFANVVASNEYSTMSSYEKSEKLYSIVY